MKNNNNITLYTCKSVSGINLCRVKNNNLITLFGFIYLFIFNISNDHDSLVVCYFVSKLRTMNDVVLCV